MNRFIKFFAVATAAALLLCSCGNDVQDSTSGYIENPLESSTTTTAGTTDNIAEAPEETLTELDKLLNLSRCSIAPKVSIKGENNYEQLYCDYNGGKIELTYDVNFVNKADVKPELMTLGVYVVINGIYQDISVNGGEQTKLYIHEFPYDTEKGGPWNGTATFEISFDPVIAESDKDEDKLLVSVGSVLNPHFKVSDECLGTGNTHNNLTVKSFIFDIKTPITDYVEVNSSTEYEKDLITDETRKKYENLYDKDHKFNYIDTRIAKDLNNYDIYVNEDGTVTASAAFSTYVDSKFRLRFLLNDLPTTISGGKDYIEIYAEQGYIYYMPDVVIDNAKPYDVLTFKVYCCPNENGETPIAPTADNTPAIRPIEQ